MPSKEHRRTKAEEQELESLIKEQRADQRAGSFQRREWFVTMSLDAVGGLSDEWSLQNHVTDDFRMPLNRDYYGCPLHGRAAMVFAAGSHGGVRCSTCYQEAQRQKYHTDAAYRQRKLDSVRRYRQNMTQEQRDRENARRRERRRLARERAATAEESGA